ncbi:MAG: threonine synthase [Spirochaetia bacterium]|jgi:threonine synthase|nr:threonine synthase [Spirochaetia bacterium]
MDFKYECSDCGKEYPSDKIIYRCPVCSEANEIGKMQKGNLITKIDSKHLQSLKLKDTVSPEDFLPYKIPNIDTFPVGNTPLSSPLRLIEKTGFKNLKIKNDGANPSGSFKDRASQLVAAQAIHFGEKTIALASTGNAGSAMACAGAAYGLDIVLFVPESAPKAKLLQSALYGAKVVPIKDNYDAAFGLSIEYTEKYGGINRNTAYNPMTIEGKKTVSIELFNQLGKKAPDVVYVPVGDGVIYSGVFKGFYDLKEAGLIDKLPKIICTQSEKSNAISKAWKTKNLNTIAAATTRADSISVASPANGRMAVRYINECDAWATEVTDEAILTAQLELGKEAGVFAEPAAACAWAAFKKDADEGKISKDAEVIVLLTGIGFKDMASVEGAVFVPESIEPTVEALKKVFG